MSIRRFSITHFSTRHLSITNLSITNRSIANLTIPKLAIKVAGLIGLSLALYTPGYAETFSVTTAAELRVALQAAQSNGTFDTIVLQPGLYSTEESGPFLYNSPDGYDLTLVGQESDPASVVISGDSQGEVLVLTNQQAGGTFTLRGLTIVGGSQAFRTENAATRIEYCAFSGPGLPAGSDLADPISPPAEPVTIMSSVFMGVDDAPVAASAESFGPAAHKGNGWMLLGSSRSVNNMRLFDSYRAVWSYQDGQWRAYSSDPAIKARLRDRKIPELNRIPPYSGFWVWRR